MHSPFLVDQGVRTKHANPALSEVCGFKPHWAGGPYFTLRSWMQGGPSLVSPCCACLRYRAPSICVGRACTPSQHVCPVRKKLQLEHQEPREPDCCDSESTAGKKWGAVVTTRLRSVVVVLVILCLKTLKLTYQLWPACSPLLATLVLDS